MEWILEHIVEFVADMIISALNFLISVFQNGVGLNGDQTLAYFFTLFSFCKVSYEVFIWAGFFILFTICVFQLFKSLFGPLSEAESPLGLVVRTIIFTVLIAFAKDICQFIINLGTIPYQILDSAELQDLALNELTNSLVAPDYASGVSSGMMTEALSGMGVALAGPIILILIIAYFVMLIKEFFKLLLEIVERYVILGLLTTVAPLCFACGASKATNHIFKSYIKMYISQIIVMCFSVFFLKAFTNALGAWFELSTAASLDFKINFNGAEIEAPNFFVCALMLLAWLKLGQKVDAHMGQLGLSVAQAGGMADSFMSGMHQQLNNKDSMASKLSNGLSNKLFGTNFGANNKGNENVWRSLKNGNQGLRAARAELKKNDKSMNVASPFARSIAAGQNKKINEAAKKGSNASVKEQRKLNKQGMSTKDFNAALNNKENLGGSAQNGGAIVGNSMKNALPIDPTWTPTDECSIKNGVATGKFIDKDGVEHTVQATLGADGKNPTVVGPDGTAYSITSADSETMAALTGADKKPGADMSADSKDMKPVENAGENMVKNDDNPELARFDSDGKVVDNPGEKPDISDEKYEKIAEDAKEAAKAADPSITDEALEKIGEEAKQEAFNEDMQNWQAQSDAYENASTIAPDGQTYAAADLENAARFDENGNAVSAPGEEPQIDDPKYAAIREEAEKAAAQDPNISVADMQAAGEAAVQSAFNEDHAKWEEQSNAYNNASIMAPDGTVKDASGNTIQGQALTTAAGVAVSADNLARFEKDASGNLVKDSNGNAVAMTKPNSNDAKYQGADGSKAYASDMAKYNSGSVVDEKGNAHVVDNNGKATGEVISGSPSTMSKPADNGFVNACRKEGTVTTSMGSGGNIAPTISSSNQMLQQNHKAGKDARALVDSNASNVHYQDQQKGNKVYDQSSGKFVAAKDAPTTNADGTHNTNIAGTYTNSSGKSVSQSEAIGGDGKLKSGFNFEPTKFTDVSKSSTAMSIASQQQSGSGVKLEMDNNNVKRFDGNGQANPSGNFVKTVGSNGQPGQLVSASAFVAGADGNVATHSLVSASGSGGTQALSTNSSGQIQTYNYDPSNAKADSRGYVAASDGKGSYVKDAGSDNYYASSSFSKNAEGQIASMQSETVGSDTYDRLVSNGQGQPQRFDGSGKASDSGSYYKSVDNAGNEKFVSASSYETNICGNTQTYTNTGSTYGNIVQTCDENGKVTGYAELADPGNGMNAPKTYNYDTATNSYVDAGSNGQYVSTMVNGEQQYSRVRPDTANSDHVYSEPIQTYTAAPVEAKICDTNGRPAETSVVGYSSMGSTVSDSGSSSYYCQDTSGNHHQIASYNDDGGIQKYSKDSSGSYYKDDNGSYAQVVNPKDPAAATYAEIPSGEIYSANKATSNGIAVTSESSSGYSAVSIDMSPSNFKKTADGVYSTNIGGEAYTLYDTAMWSGKSNDNNNNNNGVVLEMNGRSYHAIKDNSGFNVAANQTFGESYYGSNAKDLGDRYSVPSENMSSPVASKMGQGYCFHDASKPRRYVPESTDKEGNVVPAHYAQDAIFATKERPNGDPKSYKVTKDKKTGEDVYLMNTQVHYNSETGGTASLTFNKQIRDNNKSKQNSMTPKFNVVASKLVSFFNPIKGNK
jgi:hypothetical protein